MHWQSRWETLHGYQRVQQHDWQRPLRGDWTARLEEVVLDSPKPVVLVAHSLACILAQSWGARCVDAGAGGHLNADSGLGDWPQGQDWLHSLLKD